MPVCAVAIGGNMGNSSEIFASAIDSMRRHLLRPVRQSRVVQSAPMGSAAGSPFCNSAVIVDTPLSATDVLRTLQQIETAHGRTRTTKWGPRTLDLDLLFYGDDILNLPHLTVPHPAMWYRHFVLQPLSEIAADWRHPLLGERVSELFDRLSQRPLEVQIAFPGLPDQQSNTDIPELHLQQQTPLYRMTHVSQPAPQQKSVFARISFSDKAAPDAGPRKQHHRRVIDIPLQRVSAGRSAENIAALASQAVADVLTAALNTDLREYVLRRP